MKNNSKGVLKMATAAIIGCGVATTTAWATYNQQRCHEAMTALQQCSSNWSACETGAATTYSACVATCVFNGGTQSECETGECDSDYNFALSDCDSTLSSCESDWEGEVSYYCC